MSCHRLVSWEQLETGAGIAVPEMIFLPHAVAGMMYMISIMKAAKLVKKVLLTPEPHQILQAGCLSLLSSQIE